MCFLENQGVIFAQIIWGWWGGGIFVK